MREQISLNGTVETILPVETFDSGFQKQVLVVNTGGEYPQQIPVEFVNDSISKLENLQVGQPITVGINIRGNEHKGRYYANIQGWRVDAGQMGQTQAAPAPQGAAIDDEIPFAKFDPNGIY